MKSFFNQVWVVLIGLCLTVPATAAGPQHNPRVKNGLGYVFDGAYMAEPPTSVHTVPLLEIGAGWDLNMGCGTMDPEISMSNMLNGITDGFRNAMDSIISAATAAVAALPALAIQRADPDLYNMLTYGMHQAKLDFQWAETSCEEMANVMLGQQDFPWENYKLDAKFGEWSGELAASGGDPIILKEEATNQDDGNTGAQWACGVRRGGAAPQPPIQTINDITVVGYNTLFDRANACDTSTISPAFGGNQPLYLYWNGPNRAADWVVDVVGEREVRTCDGCTKVVGTPGKGLMYKYQLSRNDIENEIGELVDGVTPMTFQNLNRVSAPPGVMINKPIIDLVRLQIPESRERLITKLASEVAYARIFEMARLATQMLDSGMGEPNISSKSDAIDQAEKAIKTLDLQLTQLDRERKARKEIAEGTLDRLLGEQEKRIQGTKGRKVPRPSAISPMGQPE